MSLQGSMNETAELVQALSALAAQFPNRESLNCFNVSGFL